MQTFDTLPVEQQKSLVRRWRLRKRRVKTRPPEGYYYQILGEPEEYFKFLTPKQKLARAAGQTIRLGFLPTTPTP